MESDGIEFFPSNQNQKLTRLIISLALLQVCFIYLPFNDIKKNASFLHLKLKSYCWTCEHLLFIFFCFCLLSILIFWFNRFELLYFNFPSTNTFWLPIIKDKSCISLFSSHEFLYLILNSKLLSISVFVQMLFMQRLLLLMKQTYTHKIS